MKSTLSYSTQGAASLSDLVGDFVVYRNLVPADPRLPSIQQLRDTLGLPAHQLPRKSEPEYGQVMAQILTRARQLGLPGKTLKRIIFLGDTHLLDVTAFRNLCRAGQWDGWAFIGKDDLQNQMQIQVGDSIFQANRWSALDGFVDHLREQSFPLDEQTVVAIDMDKTAAGARGRNDQPIDDARLEGVRLTMAQLLGAEFDETAFQDIYTTLNQPAYHAFTADNQDYLAYICLMVSAGFVKIANLLEWVRSGGMRFFYQFIAWVDTHQRNLPTASLRSLHTEMYALVQAGDPTPFKAFRHNEYTATVARYDPRPPDGMGMAQLLRTRITLTREVLDFGHLAQMHGALVFALSDKPDEASTPTENQPAQEPLHRLATMVTGSKPPLP